MPEIAVDIVNVNGKNVLELSVFQGRQCPYYIKSFGDTDGVYVRYDATTRKADPATIQELRLEGVGKGYDAVECRGLKVDDASIETLCKRMYDEAVENAPSNAQRAMVKLVTRSQLMKWGVLIGRGKSVVPSNAYALLLGSDLLLTTVKCALFKGLDRAFFLDRHPIEGMSVIEQTKEAFKWILSKLNLSATFVNTKRVDIYEIPPDAIREILVNAIVHRTYVDGASSPISVALYDDRLEITSPGGLPRGMTIEKMMEGHSECRNKILAEAFAYMYFIENWGSGILRAQRLLKTAGLEPLIVKDFGNSIRMTIKRKDIGSNNMGDNTALNSVPVGTLNGTLNGTVKDVEIFFNAIAQNPGRRIPFFVDLLGKGKRTLKRYLAEDLQNLVEYRGSSRTGGYYVKEISND